VDAIVFWTRDARPLMGSLAELDQCGYRYLFLVTVLDYPAPLRARDLPVAEAVPMFRRLADRLGPERVVWRYDPLVFSNVTNGAFHAARFAALAGALHGYTRRVITSGLSLYRKNLQRLEALSQQGLTVIPKEQVPAAEMHALLRRMVASAHEHGMELVSCAETLDWQSCGIAPGRCIDDALIARALGIRVTGAKDPGQRPACGCVVSRDIGSYDTCVRGCPYCYAVADPDKARLSLAQHDPQAPSLVPLPAPRP